MHKSRYTSCKRSGLKFFFIILILFLLCVCPCVDVCPCVCICVSLYICQCLCVSNVHMCLCVYVSLCLYVWVYMCIWVCVHLWAELWGHFRTELTSPGLEAISCLVGLDYCLYGHFSPHKLWPHFPCFSTGCPNITWPGLWSEPASNPAFPFHYLCLPTKQNKSTL